MTNKIINTNKAFKICLIVYLAIFIVGIAFTVIGGVKFDINFVGGTRISYSYEGEIDEADLTKTIKGVIGKDLTVSKNTSIAGDVKTFAISLSGNNSLATQTQEDLTKKLTETYSYNSIELYDSNSVSPTVAGNFLLKSLAAVVLTAIFVIIYVGIRFRRIGGVSAAITALCALVFDILVSFFVCVIFRLQIDSNYIAVILTILGYSLNDTIVIYDRVRENKKLFPDKTVEENMDMSVTGILTRNIVTTTTTVLAVITIIVVAEIYGLASLRTFVIPMVFALVSGCMSSLFISGPLWVKWCNRKAARKTKKA